MTNQHVFFMSSVAKTFGPFSDCTSNQVEAKFEINQENCYISDNILQWEAYMQLCKPDDATLLKQSVALSRQISSDFPSVTVEELAFEIAVSRQRQNHLLLLRTLSDALLYRW